MLAVIVFAAFVASPGHACEQFFVGGQPPAATAVTQLCFDGYSLGHDPATRGPRWSAEHLTAAGVAAALKAKRAGDFHPEPLLPVAARATPKDYDCSGFDRGHMTPVGDFGVASQEDDTFTMANMVPQAPELNEGVWAGIEGAVRALAQADGELYVVTGPAFGSHPGAIGSGVKVPSATWKAVYDPKLDRAAAYIAPNDATGAYRVAALDDLTLMIGFDPMPGLSHDAKMRALDLPPATKGNSVLPSRACHFLGAKIPHAVAQDPNAKVLSDAFAMTTETLPH